MGKLTTSFQTQAKRLEDSRASAGIGLGWDLLVGKSRNPGSLRCVFNRDRADIARRIDVQQRVLV
jgi:hypothetical protein